MESFNNTKERLGLTKLKEIYYHLNAHTLTEKQICSEYNVTSWFLMNFKQRLSAKISGRDEMILRDHKSGMNTDALCAKYSLAPSRISNIINNLKLSEDNSKQLW